LGSSTHQRKASAPLPDQGEVGVRSRQRAARRVRVAWGFGPRCVGLCVDAAPPSPGERLEGKSLADLSRLAAACFVAALPPRSRQPRERCGSRRSSVCTFPIVCTLRRAGRFIPSPSGRGQAARRLLFSCKRRHGRLFCHPGAIRNEPGEGSRRIASRRSFASDISIAQDDTDARVRARTESCRRKELHITARGSFSCAT